MKARKLMCYGPFCHPKKIKHDRETMVVSRNGQKHYCHKCWNYISKQSRDRNLLYSYIRNKPSVTISFGMMIREIKTLQTKYGYTFRGIKTALVYASKLVWILNLALNTSYTTCHSFMKRRNGGNTEKISIIIWSWIIAILITKSLMWRLIIMYLNRKRSLITTIWVNFKLEKS